MDMAMGGGGGGPGPGPMMGPPRGMGMGPPRRMGPPPLMGGPPFMRPRMPPPPRNMMAPDPSYGKKGPDQEEMLSDMGYLCVPKNPVVILRDMTDTEHIYDFRVEATDEDYEEHKNKHGYYPNYLHKCMVTVDGKPYFGCGDTKRTAKEKAAYAAIPDVVSKFCARQRPIEKDLNGIPFFSRSSEIPWGLLCGLAIHKMYEEWRTKGYEISQKMEKDLNAENSDW